jgi:hypothetical protein
MRPQRPRDRSGRPLPRGTGPEGGAVAPLSPGAGDRSRVGAGQVITAASALLAQDRPFAAHEVFEEAWKTGPPDERDLWRGLAQVAVALTHAQRGNAAGERALRTRAARLLRESAPGAGLGSAGALAAAPDGPALGRLLEG